jgi:hypothetical protein
MNSCQKGTKYKCIPCQYNTDNKTKFDRHTKTLKHFKKLNPEYKEEPIIYKCNNCDKIYQHISGLSRHKKKCIHIIQEPQLISNTDIPVLIELIQSQNEKIDLLTNEVQELKKNGINNITNITNNNNNNTTNNISLIVQLNTNCSNATTLEDFGNNIEVEEEQLNYLLSNGLEKGIAYTLLENLNLLPKIQRPLWVADKKRRKFLIKEINEWIEDNNREKLNKLYSFIQRFMIKLYVKLNPMKTIMSDKEKDAFCKNYKILSNDINCEKICDNLAVNPLANYK